ncbi:MAG: class I SAM-dependent methyltransferase [bacterium]
METVACNLCGSSQQELLWEGQDWMLGYPGQFTMVRCVNCGLIFLNPRPAPDEMGLYYPDDYEPFRRTARALKSPVKDLVRRVKLLPRVRIVCRSMAGGHLLDVGCAAGGFLREMDRTGKWSVRGIEPNAHLARFARKAFGLNVFSGRLAGARFPDETFDVVTMWDVLEHVYDPQATLREVRRILKPGGVFIASVPNADSVDAQLFGRYWVGLDFPRHLYVFSESTLTDLLEKARLRPERFFCFYGRYTTFALSLSLWLNAQIHNQVWQRRLRALLLLPIFRYLTMPYFLTLDALKLGAIITVRARK